MKRALLLISCLLIVSLFFILEKNKSAKLLEQQRINNAVSNAQPIAAQAPVAQVTTPKASTVVSGKHLKNNFDYSKYSQATQAKVKTLNEILISKNDNDQRLDTDLKNLTTEDKTALKDYYQDLKSESLNERGTIVFLLGRGLKTTDDMDFLKTVLSEEPCLSMDNCAVHGVTKDSDLSSMEQISLTYPQQMAMEALSTWAKANATNIDSNLRQHLDDTLKQAERSPIASVQRKASELENSLKR